MLKLLPFVSIALVVSAACGSAGSKDGSSVEQLAPAATAASARDEFESDRPPGPLAYPPIIVERRSTADVLWAPLSGQDLTTMAGAHKAVVLVRVRGSEDLTWAEQLPGLPPRSDFPSIDGATGQQIDPNAQDEELPPGHPKAGKPRPIIDPETFPPTLSRYDLEVIEVLGGSIGSEPLTVFQTGGVKNGIAYESAGNPVIEVGRTYVMFLSFDEKGWHWSTPWGRFEVAPDGSLLPVAADEWRLLGVRQQLEGKTLSDLRSMVASLRFSS